MRYGEYVGAIIANEPIQNVNIVVEDPSGDIVRSVFDDRYFTLPYVNAPSSTHVEETDAKNILSINVDGQNMFQFILLFKPLNLKFILEWESSMLQHIYAQWQLLFTKNSALGIEQATRLGKHVRKMKFLFSSKMEWPNETMKAAREEVEKFHQTQVSNFEQFNDELQGQYVKLDQIYFALQRAPPLETGNDLKEFQTFLDTIDKKWEQIWLAPENESAVPVQRKIVEIKHQFHQQTVNIKYDMAIESKSKEQVEELLTQHREALTEKQLKELEMFLAGLEKLKQKAEPQKKKAKIPEKRIKTSLDSACDSLPLEIAYIYRPSSRHKLATKSDVLVDVSHMLTKLQTGL